MGQWLSVCVKVVHSFVNGIELLAQEFCDSLHLHYTRSPADLPTHCDGCGQKFSVCHGLECKKGGLVILCHNKIQDELSDLASKAFTPSTVCNEPKIHTGHPMEQNAVEQSSSPVSHNLCNNQNEDHGDVLIHSLWANGTDCIIDICITDTDAKPNESPGNTWTREKEEVS
jgi:hypothetical protein